MSHVSLAFLWGSPAAAVPVFSVFIPFLGCPRRCVFCSQHEQTGQRPLPLDEILGSAAAALRHRRRQGRPAPELAFYGGTFTALPAHELDACLRLARSLIRDGCVTAFRCSTRPDRLDAPLLAHLRRHGCRAVELGIQSFADTALQASERHYSGGRAEDACRLVRRAGLALGVQLLPGMPGHGEEDFLADVRRALALGADMLRFYPCLVLAGTELARRWHDGLYTPWPLPRTLLLLARGWLYARRAGVPVIRMGLAPEAAMEAALLAGPADRNLGGRVLGRALWLHVCACLLGLQGGRAAENEARAAALLERLLTGAATPPGLPRAQALYLPRSCQGFFRGPGGELERAWAALGITRRNRIWTPGHAAALHPAV